MTGSGKHPLEGHPSFTQPDDPEIKIWRYVDFSKYVDFIQRKQLFLSRTDLLGDPFEGSSPRWSIEERRRMAADLKRRQLEANVSTSIADDFETMIAKINKATREWTYVNCWHMSGHESAAMWNLYAESNQAIAIQSTYSRLRECLPGGPGSLMWVYIGVVSYIDYETDEMSQYGNAYTPFCFKRKSFEHEQELRAVYHDMQGMSDERVLRKGVEPGPPGVHVDIDIPHLVERVRVAPTAPDWFFEVVQKTSATYGLTCPIERSALDARALF